MEKKKHHTYFGTTVKIGVGVGAAYLLWWLYHNGRLPFSGPGHWGWNPWGGGGNADKGEKPTGRDQGGAGGSNKNADYKTAGDESNSAGMDVIVTKTGGYTKYPDGNYYDDKGNKYIEGPPMSRTDFIQKYFPAAVKGQKITGVFPETMFAQAIFESADSNGTFGAGDAAKNANNYFGIHADNSWSGDTYQAMDGGVYVPFRSYPSIEDSIVDYYNFLNSNSRYNAALKANTPQDQINAIAAAGYAESPTYASSLNSLVPWIMAAEKSVPNVDNSYTPTAVDAAVNTDKMLDAANDNPTYKDKAVMYYAAHQKTFNWLAAGVVVVVAGAVITDGYTKNPLRGLYKKSA